MPAQETVCENTLMLPTGRGLSHRLLLGYDHHSRKNRDFWTYLGSLPHEWRTTMPPGCKFHFASLGNLFVRCAALACVGNCISSLTMDSLCRPDREGVARAVGPTDLTLRNPLRSSTPIFTEIALDLLRLAPSKTLIVTARL